MSNTETVNLIRERLTANLAPDMMELTDESHRHIGHHDTGGAGHFALTIASPAFNNKTLVQCHRMVYEALGELMGPKIHAINIKVVRKE